MFSLIVWEVSEQLNLPSAPLPVWWVFDRWRKLLGIRDQRFQTGVPLVSRSRGPHVLHMEDKAVIVQRDRSRAHLSAAPPIIILLGCTSGILCLPSGSKRAQRSGREWAPVGRTDGKVSRGEVKTCRVVCTVFTKQQPVLQLCFDLSASRTTPLFYLIFIMPFIFIDMCV